MRRRRKCRERLRAWGKSPGVRGRDGGYISDGEGNKKTRGDAQQARRWGEPRAGP